MTDVGKYLLCRVTASNPTGSAQAFSNVVGPVTAAATAAFAFIASTGAGATAGSSADCTTPAIDTTGAGLLVVGVSIFSSLTPTVTDNKGNTWTPLTLYNNGTTGYGTSVIFYSVPTSVGAGHTVTVTLAGSYPAATFAAFAGGAATPFDVETVGEGSASTTVSAGAGITPTVPNALVIANVGHALPASAVVTAISDGFNLLTPIPRSGTSMGEALAYKIQTAALAVDPTWTIDVASDSAATIASFKP